MTTTVKADRRQEVAEAAYRIRHHVLNMGEAQGQGYVGQALGAADMLAAVYADQLRYRADDPHWDGRDRFLLSTGHYAIGLYAALAEAGIVPEAELDSYGSDGSRLPMSGMASYTPGMEISGGSLGHGLTVAVGMALGLRHQGSGARVINFLSDGELDEGSTWEAAMGAAHHRLGNLIAMVDINALQADGPTVGVLRTEPVADKWAAFGWHVQRVDGNDVEPCWTRSTTCTTESTGAPSVILCDTRVGCGVPLLETREKAHFMRIDADEWQVCREQLTAGHQKGASMSTAAPLRTSAMIASFADPGQKTTPAPFGHALVAAAQADDRIVGLTADLGKYTDMHIFAQAFPERFFQMGMAEQLLFGAAAGMAETGLVPFASTYSVFAARRAYDFICLDIAEPGLNVNIVGGLPGLTTGYGPSHQATEDVAIFRGIPGLTIVDPCDSVDIERCGTATGGQRRPHLPAAAARAGAHRARRVRLHLRVGQGQGAARRRRRGADLQRADDDAGPAGRRRAGRHTTSTSLSCTPPRSNPSTAKPCSPRSTRTASW